MHPQYSTCDTESSKRELSKAMLSILLSPRSMMKQISIVIIQALLDSSFASPQNVPGGRLFPPGSHGDRGGEAGSSIAEKDATNEKLFCSGDT